MAMSDRSADQERGLEVGSETTKLAYAAPVLFALGTPHGLTRGDIDMGYDSAFLADAS